MPHDSRRAPEEVFISDQVRSRPTYLSGLGVTGLLSGGLRHSHCFVFPEDKADIRTRKKFQLHLAGLSSILPPRGA